MDSELIYAWRKIEQDVEKKEEWLGKLFEMGSSLQRWHLSFQEGSNMGRSKKSWLSRQKEKWMPKQGQLDVPQNRERPVQLGNSEMGR